ncbi:MAG: hypothetical protein NVS3B20_12720 [Polyangiales bacterium]
MDVVLGTNNAVGALADTNGAVAIVGDAMGGDAIGGGADDNSLEAMRTRGSGAARV